MNASVGDDIFGMDEVKLLVEVEVMSCCCCCCFCCWNNNGKYRGRYNGLKLPTLCTCMGGVLPTLNSCSVLDMTKTNYHTSVCTDVQQGCISPLLI